ncbi:MAG TPA: S-adenosylmethionine:tRNA ribosyltransferase-isomerase [Cytophagaceae bacterium]|jgi:S-adenosylmethionine:tRNA ribosyltransferase-isomerase|nr:S-adenosylmethionine:tRNA ribosyltransferase-isomerase [Cytophagaceae bacterium]
MQHLPAVDLEAYRYHLPKERIALYPVSPRDHSKLLVYKKEGIREDVFQSLPHHVPPGALMVFNQTKVIRARLLFHTSTGAQVEIFCLEPTNGEEQVSALSAQESVHWKCFVGNAKKWKQEVLVQSLGADQKIELSARLMEKKEDYYVVQFFWTPSSLSWADILDVSGKMPLPPYIKRDALSEEEESYQTVYARIKGSVAAPTAGLHFTNRVLDELRSQDVQLLYTTLHVGAGTFKPIKSNSIQAHDMHEEELIIEQSFIEQLLLHAGKPLVAVGTTSVRCIESLYWIAARIKAGAHTVNELNVKQWDPYNLSTSLTPFEALEVLLSWLREHQLNSISIKTSILIVPGYRFKYINMLVTNFHQPESTLMLLVAAFVGKNWGKIYQYALENDFRFLSYGDSSLLSRDCE